MARSPRITAWTRVPQQAGRRFVVTGATSGIGLETARALAEAGARVVLAVRSRDRGEAAAATMRGDVEVRVLDVSDLFSGSRTASASTGSSSTWPPTTSDTSR